MEDDFVGDVLVSFHLAGIEEDLRGRSASCDETEAMNSAARYPRLDHGFVITRPCCRGDSFNLNLDELVLHGDEKASSASGHATFVQLVRSIGPAGAFEPGEGHFLFAGLRNSAARD